MVFQGLFFVWPEGSGSQKELKPLDLGTIYILLMYCFFASQRSGWEMIIGIIFRKPDDFAWFFFIIFSIVLELVGSHMTRIRVQKLSLWLDDSKLKYIRKLPSS